MKFSWLLAVVVALTLAACVESRLQACGQGVVCGADRTCIVVAATPVCVSAAELAACADTPDGAECSVNNVGGTCANGACLVATCGNGIIEKGEDCDTQIDATCESLGYYGGALGCTDFCRFNETQCLGFCGDGKLQQAFEVCDDGNNANGDGCARNCDSTEVCGNGVIDSLRGEQCDDGAAGVSGDGCSATCLLEVETWTAATPAAIERRKFSAMTYDTKRKRVVLFGGQLQSAILGDTWEFDGVNWQKRDVAHSPPARMNIAMTYDAQRGVTVLFGGDGPSAFYSDTWEYDGVDWLSVATATSPSPRRQPALAYHAASNRVILFGGSSTATGTNLRDTWAYDGTNWTALTPATRPPASGLPQLAADTSRNRLVLLGVSVNQTWEFDGTNWVAKSTATMPTQYGGFNLVYDASRNITVCFDRDATWEYNGTSWTQRTLTPAPAARLYAAGTYDPVGRRVLLHGGQDNAALEPLSDTWAYNGGWTRILTPRAPAARRGAAMAFDPLRGVSVMFGGWNDSGQLVADTWEFDGTNWLRRVPTESPTARYFTHATWDPVRKMVVVAGGADLSGHAFTDAWAWDGVSWTRIANDGQAVSWIQALYFDERLDVLRAITREANGMAVWDLQGGIWTARATGPGPHVVSNPLVAYDRRRGVAVLFGGYDHVVNRAFDHTWELGDTWREVVTTLAPPPRSDGNIVYAERLSRMLVFGGERDDSSAASDAWAWDGATWSRRQPALVAPARTRGATAYDSWRGTVVTFGGYDVALSGPRGDTWKYGALSASATAESCTATTDGDGDGLVACGTATAGADPDCAGRCYPMCPLWNLACGVGPACGDGMCDATREDYALCPADCMR